MVKHYSVADARAHLPHILDEVEAGKDVHLTRRGRPVAVVLSTQHYETLRGQQGQFGEAYHDFIARHSAAELDLDTAFFDGLREKHSGRPVRL